MADTDQTHRAHRVSRVKIKEEKKQKHEKGFNPRVSQARLDENICAFAYMPLDS